MQAIHDPEDFSADFAIVGLILRCEQHILVLRRSQSETWPGTWGLPAGKVESGESPDEALVREIREELGLEVTGASFVHAFSVRYPGHYDFTYRVYEYVLDEIPELTLDPAEHDQFAWMAPQEVTQLADLIPGEKEAMQTYIELKDFR